MIRLHFLAVLLAGVSGCRPSAAPTVATPSVSHVTAELAVPRPGTPTYPTEFRLYQLTSLQALERTTYDELLTDDRAALGDTLVAGTRQDVTLYAAEVWRQPLELRKAARYLLVVAFLHRPVGDAWRVALALPPPSSRNAFAYDVRVGAAQVTVKPRRLVEMSGEPPARERRWLDRLRERHRPIHHSTRPVPPQQPTPPVPPAITPQETYAPSLPRL